MADSGYVVVGSAAPPRSSRQADPATDQLASTTFRIPAAKHKNQ
ncbi:MAG TPA: hypothetical protein VIJ01_19140 [Candidatus Angelobacter sp.]